MSDQKTNWITIVGIFALAGFFYKINWQFTSFVIFVVGVVAALLLVRF